MSYYDYQWTASGPVDKLPWEPNGVLVIRCDGVEVYRSDKEMDAAAAMLVAYSKMRHQFAAAQAEIERLRKAIGQLQRCLLPPVMAISYAKLGGQPFDDKEAILSFMGGGCSDCVTVGQLNAAVSAARDAITPLAAATEQCQGRE